MASNKIMPHSQPQQTQKGSSSRGPAGAVVGEHQEKRSEPLISDNPWPSNVPDQPSERQE